MKITKIEKWLLLERSGELSPRCQRLLDACPEAQKKRAELNELCAALPHVAVEPSPWTVAKIDARLNVRRRFAAGGSRVWKHVFTMAACMALVVSTWNFRQTSPIQAGASVPDVESWNIQFEEDLVELEGLISMISSDPLDMPEL